MFFVFFVLGGRGKDLSTPSRIKDADPRGHGRRHAYFIQIVNYRSISKKIIFFRDSEICTVHEGLPPVIVHARLRATVVLPAVGT